MKTEVWCEWLCDMCRCGEHLLC